MAMAVGRPVNIMKDNGAAAIFYIMHVLTRDDPEARHALTSRERLGNGMRHTLAGKIFFTVVALFAASFLLYQVMTVSSKKISTEYVLHYSYYDAITADGYFVRNEQVLTHGCRRRAQLYGRRWESMCRPPVLWQRFTPTRRMPARRPG